MKTLTQSKSFAFRLCFWSCISVAMLGISMVAHSAPSETSQGQSAQKLNNLYQVVKENPKLEKTWIEIGYLNLELDQPQKALDAFNQAISLNPGNETIKLQRGYLLQRLGKNREASQTFRDLENSKNQDISLKANDAHTATRGLPDRVFPSPFFGEIYLAPEYNSHWGLTTLPVQARVGASFGTTYAVEPYLSYRDTIDNRTGTNGAFGSQIYNDTVAVMAAGLRLKPDRSIPLTFFIEEGRAYDRLDSPTRERWRSDTRGGFLFYKEWRGQLPLVGPVGSPRFVSDLYADTVYFSRYSGNWISYLRFRPGYRFYDGDMSAADLYVHAAINSDSRNEIDNRYTELGVGVAYRIYAPLRLTLRTVGIHVQPKEGRPSYDTLKIILEHESRF